MRFVSVGECVVELTGGRRGGYQFGLAGQVRDMAILMRGRLGPEWSVDLFTALGDDHHSQLIIDGLRGQRIGIGSILKIAGRNVGLVMREGSESKTIASWRGQAAARWMADDVDLLARAFDGADVIFVSGAAFAILMPRGRGRLLKALHRARLAGTRIALAPHEWPELWTSLRVMGSAVNSISMVADIILTNLAAETSLYGDATPDAVAARYVEWGATEIFIRLAPDRAFVGGDATVGPFTLDPSSQVDGVGAAYLAARTQTASITEAVAAISGTR